MKNLDWYYMNSSEDLLRRVSWKELQELAKEGTVGSETLVYWQGLATNGIYYRDINALFFYDFQATTQFAYTEDELHQAANEGKISPKTIIWGWELPEKGVTYDSFQFTDLVFIPETKGFLELRHNSPTTILSGPNNSGKTLLLKLLRKEIGPSANYLACNRFFHPNQLNYSENNFGQYNRRHQEFVTNLYRQKQNTENNDYPLEQILGSMNDNQRDTLLEICGEMLGEKFSLIKTNPNNKLSPYYVDVGGKNLAYSSTGTRLLLMLVAACLDENCSFFLIDEPEIGLSPKMQAVLAKYLLDPDLRNLYFPHIKQLFIATHSHLFLDRSDISNNFAVIKNDGVVTIAQIESMGAFHNLQFNMLGNDLQALFLPEAIIIVEGESDYIYIQGVFGLFFRNHRISVVKSRGEGDTKEKLYVIRDLLGDLMKSPYRQRVFVLLDKLHSNRERDFTKHGIPVENVVVLEKNGIEYYYPAEILTEIFSCGPNPNSKLEILENSVRVNDIELKKIELSKVVVNQMNLDSIIPNELDEKLLKRARLLFGD